ncbi:MAG TPA: NifU family protein, partial [Solirubrobacteraceae bacterium]
MSADVSPAELLEAVEELSGRVDALEDEEARELAQDLVAAVVAMYGDGLRRIMEVIGEARGAEDLLDELAQDGAVASLLLIHDLYPVPLEQRVLEALDTVRPYMESHGGNVELLGIEDGVAKLAMQGSCDGCAASRSTLELAIKQALDEHAPDLLDLEVEGVTPPAPIAGNGTGGFELPMVHSDEADLPMADAQPASWIPLEQATGLSPGELRAVQVDAMALLVI